MKSLAGQLDGFMQALLARVDPATAAVFAQAEQARAAVDVAAKAVGAGDRAPDFSLPDQHGRMHGLRAALNDGPVVLLFFRGGWCPFCSLTLRAFDRVAGQMRAAGASLLAVSPQTEAVSLATAERNALRFPLLADAENAVARRYGLVWHLDPAVQALYARLGHDLPRLNGSESWDLPMAAGYVIAPDGVVRLAQVSPQVNRRLEPALALEALGALQIQMAK